MLSGVQTRGLDNIDSVCVYVCFAPSSPKSALPNSVTIGYLHGNTCRYMYMYIHMYLSIVIHEPICSNTYSGIYWHAHVVIHMYTCTCLLVCLLHYLSTHTHTATSLHNVTSLLTTHTLSYKPHPSLPTVCIVMLIAK